MWNHLLSHVQVQDFVFFFSFSSSSSERQDVNIWVLNCILFWTLTWLFWHQIQTNSVLSSITFHFLTKIKRWSYLIRAASYLHGLCQTLNRAYYAFLSTRILEVHSQWLSHQKMNLSEASPSAPPSELPWIYCLFSCLCMFFMVGF